MKSRPSISVIIPTFRRKADLLHLLESVAASDYPQDKLEVIVVDNANDLTEEDLKTAAGNVKLILAKPNENLFCSGGRLYGAKLAAGQYFFFIDDDNILAPDCITLLADSLSKSPSLGMTGPLMLIFRDKQQIWCAGGVLNGMAMTTHLEQGKSLANVNLAETIPDIDYFPNAFMIKREALEKVPFDIINFPHNFSEPDFGLRLKQAGYTSATVTSAHDWHNIDYDGPTTRINSRNVYDQAKSRLIFRKRFFDTPKYWLLFWGIIFPASTLYYLKGIATSEDKKKATMLIKYIKGTIDGIKMAVSPDVENAFALREE